VHSPFPTQIAVSSFPLRRPKSPTFPFVVFRQDSTVLTGLLAHVTGSRCDMLSTIIVFCFQGSCECLQALYRPPDRVTVCAQSVWFDEFVVIAPPERASRLETIRRGLSPLRLAEARPSGCSSICPDGTLSSLITLVGQRRREKDLFKSSDLRSP